jgi:hypothetical protein
MGTRRAREAQLRRSLKRVLQRAGGVGTLTHLVELVNEELEREDPSHRVSGPRLRRIAVTEPEVRVVIHTRRAQSTRLSKTCPVCRSSLKRVENRTLTGDRVTLEARCTVCPYWTGRARRIPTRYGFHYAKE